jgi:hypothetical protein
MIRFGMWDAILAEPTPDPKLRGLTGGYTYAKTVALAAKGRTDEAKASLVDLERIANAAGLDDTTGLNAAKDHAARRLRKSVDRCGRGTDRIGVLTWMSHDMLAEPEAAPRPRRRVRGLTSWKGPTDRGPHAQARKSPAAWGRVLRNGVLPHQTPGTSYAASVAVPPRPNALAHAILAMKRRRLCGFGTATSEFVSTA